MKRIDFKKELNHLYRPTTKRIDIVDVPEMNFLMVDGKGDPNTAKEYSDAIEALYSVSYTLKFMVKKNLNVDYGVLPLEGLWWADDMNNFSTGTKDKWNWTALIMQPQYVTKDRVEEAFETVRKKKDLPALQKMKFASFNESLSAQTMHIGPYADEGPTIQRVHDFIRESDYELRGKHHEIYMSDPRRSKPEKLKTIIRQPIKKK
jgi:hypothetical protein